MTPAAAVLAVDGGNSKTDVALIAADGRVLASRRGPGASREYFGNEGAVARLGALVAEVAALAGLGDGPVARHTSACLAGVDLPEEEREMAAAISAAGWSETAAVANDSFAVLRAGLPAGQTSGIGVVCGAGINCVGVAPDGRVARYLSFGELSGDWGGGLDLGAAVLWHAMRAEDGRGGPTRLLDGVTAHFGLPTASAVAIAVRAGRYGRDDLRQLTPVLFAAARAGDQVAVRVVERQAEEICVMALTAMRRLGLDNAPVVLGGGVLEAREPLLTDGIGRRLAAAGCGPARVVDAPPVTGAGLLGLDFLERLPAGVGRDGGPGAWRAAEERLRSSRLHPAR